MQTTLHLNAINNAATYERRKHAAYKYIQGYFNLEEYRKECRDIMRDEASEARRKFKQKISASEIKESGKLLGEYMLAHVKECISGDYDNGRPIRVHVKRWWDSLNGNSYWSARAFIPLNDGRETMVYFPFSYGYGSQPEWDVLRGLIDFGILEEKAGGRNHPGEYPINFEDFGYTLKRNL